MTLRLAFMGTPQFAVPTLAELIGQRHTIVCVYSQPPRPKGRGLETIPSAVHQLALAHNITIRTPASLKDSAQQQLFAELALDAAVVVAYGLILPRAILESPRLGCFNLHGSLLPRWRGAAPVQRAIMAGDAETGVMSMRMEEGLDTGPVLMAERTRVGRKTYGELHDELARLGADVMARTMSAVERGSAQETKQSEDGVSYAKKIAKSETQILWSKSAHQIDCQVRGLSPVPGAWCEINGERLKILNCMPVDAAGPPGNVLDDQLTVACGEASALRLTRLQRAGKSAMDGGELLRGFAVGRGTRLS